MNIGHTVEDLIHDPETIKTMQIYMYHHIDLLLYIPSADSVLGDAPNKVGIIQQLRERFLEAGWEGDGEIGMIWIPPFFYGLDKKGICIWHVKQSNNGTSWLVSPVKLSPRAVDAPDNNNEGPF